MRLLNFYTEGAQKALGLVEGDRVLNLTRAVNGQPDFASVTNWLRGGDAARQATDEIRRRATAAESGTALAEVRHAPLVERDCRIFCVGLNYADHAAENNLPPPESPIFFTKLASVVIPHGTAIPMPRITRNVDYEAEFAVVIGSRADGVDEAEGAACIAGFTMMNDVSARDLQRGDKQWFRGKNCNGFGPLGPWLVTADEIEDPGNLDISLRLNGAVRQHSNTRNLVFPPAKLISILSQTLVLEPGDVISTGTPSGVGVYSKPPVFLKPGDRVEVEVAGIGVLENSVADGQVS